MTRRVLFGHAGQRGDLFMNLPSIKLLWFLNPEVSFYLPIHKQYQDMIPLFLHLPYLDGIFITDEYENFPNKLDSENLRKMKFVSVYNPMQQHLDEWYRKRHQTQTVYFDYFNNEPPPEFDCQIELSKYFDISNIKNDDTIAFAPFAGFYNPNNKKRLSMDKAQQIAELIKKMGYNILQIGGHDEPKLPYTSFPKLSYVDSIKNILSCKMLISTDTGVSWAASGYKFPMLGLYSHEYYGKDFVKNIQPVNQNAIYLSENNVNEIELDKIEENIKNIIK